MMASVNFCISLLLLYLTRDSLQGGVNPQGNNLGGLYYSPEIREKYSSHGLPAGLGVQNGFGAAQGIQNGFGAAQGFGDEPEKPGGLYYRNSAGYGAGYGRDEYQHVVQHPLRNHGTVWHHPMDHGNLWHLQTGHGTRDKPFKEGYFGGVGVRGFPSSGIQNAFGNGYGVRDNRFPSAGSQPGGYENGVQIPYRSKVGGLPGVAASATASNYGGAEKNPYKGQVQQPETTALGDYGAAGRYANGNGLGYTYGKDRQTNGLAGPNGPFTPGQAPGQYVPTLGLRQPSGNYRGKESKDRINQYMRNGYKALHFQKMRRGKTAQ